MRDVVSMCCAMGLTHEQIAQQVNFPTGITKSVLQRHFKAELDDGGMRIHLRVASNMARIAMDANHKGVVLAGMFWLKSRLGWQGQDQQPVNVGIGFKGKGELPAVFTLRIGDKTINGDGSDDDS